MREMRIVQAIKCNLHPPFAVPMQLFVIVLNIFKLIVLIVCVSFAFFSKFLLRLFLHIVTGLLTIAQVTATPAYTKLAGHLSVIVIVLSISSIYSKLFRSSFYHCKILHR